MMQEHEALTEDEQQLLETPISQLMKLGRVRSALDAKDKKIALNRKEKEAQNESPK